LPEQQVERGCVYDTPIPGRWQIDGKSYSRCPMAMATSQSYDYVSAYNLFKNGYLPNGSGWVRESKKFLQAMQVIEKLAQKDGK